MSTPDFLTLEAMPGRSDLRLVDKTWMDREEYEACGWHIVGSYVNDKGERVPYWCATIAGLRRYGALRQQRRADRGASAIARDEYDDEFREYVNAIDNAKPGGRP